MKAKQNSFTGTFLKTLGVILPFLLLALLVLGVVFVHDNLLIGNHNKSPQYSTDSNWGNIKVSVDFPSWNIVEPTKSKKEKCFLSEYYEQNQVVSNARDWATIVSGCTKSSVDGQYYVTVLAEDGSVDISGKIYIKNRAWNSSSKIPPDLLQLEYGDKKYINASINGFSPGQFLRPRRGTSGTFSIQGPYEARDGVLILKDGDITAELK